jgi:hypothetical protein
MGGIVSGIREERMRNKILRENTKINLLASEWNDPQRPKTPDASHPRSPSIIWKEKLEMTGLFYQEVRLFSCMPGISKPLFLQSPHISAWRNISQGGRKDMYPTLTDYESRESVCTFL